MQISPQNASNPNGTITQSWHCNGTQILVPLEYSTFPHHPLIASPLTHYRRTPEPITNRYALQSKSCNAEFCFTLPPDPDEPSTHLAVLLKSTLFLLRKISPTPPSNYTGECHPCSCSRSEIVHTASLRIPPERRRRVDLKIHGMQVGIYPRLSSITCWKTPVTLLPGLCFLPLHP